MAHEALQLIKTRKIAIPDNSNKKAPLTYSKLCVPYFKDSSGMSAPMNEDGRKKVNKGYLDLYTIRSKPCELGREA